MAEVWAHSKAKSTALLVQLALADHANDETRLVLAERQAPRQEVPGARKHRPAPDPSACEASRGPNRVECRWHPKGLRGRCPNRYVLRSYPAADPSQSGTPTTTDTP